jgi:hypothetical protein
MTKEVDIHCPKCEYKPHAEDRWACIPRCGTSWHTFWTGGICPGCGIRWPKTQCPQCGALSPHGHWYHYPRDEPAAQFEHLLELDRAAS